MTNYYLKFMKKQVDFYYAKVCIPAKPFYLAFLITETIFSFYVAEQNKVAEHAQVNCFQLFLLDMNRTDTNICITPDIYKNSRSFICSIRTDL